ncbi:N-acetylmuramoyl-L-alanine amidase [Roseivivax marinus]|uniref:N-acetylmuramoyl-L-alanine amidase n=1 Tax=Roseivivax marinus TaxID=1379903 RepID=W4HRK6_9RHOB|nr:N-acetylmuramoyl-L-alanine amidase [Roseivivax marinus]ETW14650.1 N-acetylmuramoyl-L-alanine amidase [Roseivivax marinus]UMA66116.1 N-acetylmuramoyl-L-alanine amidase [Roseivivax marinus]
MRHILRLAAILAATLTAAPVAAQELGGLARLDASQSYARDLRPGGGTELRLALSQGVPWRVFTLDDPARLVLDFREVDWSGVDPATLLRGERVQAIRVGPYRPGWSRLTADLSGPMEVTRADLRLDAASAGMLTVALEPTDDETFADLSGPPRDARWDLPAPARTAPAPGPDGILKVVLDPGHGGVDPGAEHGGATEAQLMLTFARELKEMLLRSGGFDVVMTREADAFVSLEARVAAAHRAGADVFLSLHADAIEEGVARGATVYMLARDAQDAATRALVERHERGEILTGVDLSEADDHVADVLMDLARLDTQPRSRALAEALVSGIKGASVNVHKHPIRQAGFSVLKAADIPSALIEVGFLSTDAELANMLDPEWRAGMAAGIRDGLRAWAADDAALADLRRR